MAIASKNRRRRILTGLVVTHLVLHAAALTMILSHFLPSESWSDVFLYALFMLGPSQATLVAVWAALGGGRLVWRVLPTILGVIAYLWCFRAADTWWQMMIFGQICVWGPLLLVARATGLKLIWQLDPGSVSRPSQFHIRDMLEWTTALAVVLSLLRALPTNWIPGRPSLPEVVISCGSLGLITGVAIPCALGSRWLVRRVLALPLAVALGTWLWTRMHGQPEMWRAALILGLMAAWLIGSLLVVRWAGYRLVWRWPLIGHGVGTGLGHQDELCKPPGQCEAEGIGAQKGGEPRIPRQV